MTERIRHQTKAAAIATAAPPKSELTTSPVICGIPPVLAEAEAEVAVPVDLLSAVPADAEPVSAALVTDPAVMVTPTVGRWPLV